MPELDVNGPHRANAGRRWNPAVRDRNYVYRGRDRDIYEDANEERGWSEYHREEFALERGDDA